MTKGLRKQISDALSPKAREHFEALNKLAPNEAVMQAICTKCRASFVEPNEAGVFAVVVDGVTGLVFHPRCWREKLSVVVFHFDGTKLQ